MIMKNLRIFKTVNYWIDVPLEEGENPEEVAGKFRDSSYEDWDSEEIDSGFFEEDVEDEYYNESMDGDFDSAMASAGYGTDEDYGYYGSEE